QLADDQPSADGLAHPHVVRDERNWSSPTERDQVPDLVLERFEAFRPMLHRTDVGTVPDRYRAGQRVLDGSQRCLRQALGAGWLQDGDVQIELHPSREVYGYGADMFPKKGCAYA